MRIFLPLVFFLGLLPAAVKAAGADRIVVEKSARRLVLLAAGEEIRSYRIALGGNPRGPKERSGDLRTPEGTYRICGRNPQSRFYRALRISYPSETDLARSRRLGVEPGGDIMIHGLSKKMEKMGALHFQVDWTQGCIAVTNREIDEIWQLVPDGTPIEIRP